MADTSRDQLIMNDKLLAFRVELKSFQSQWKEYDMRYTSDFQMYRRTQVTCQLFSNSHILMANSEKLTDCMWTINGSKRDGINKFSHFQYANLEMFKAALNNYSLLKLCLFDQHLHVSFFHIFYLRIAPNYGQLSVYPFLFAITSFIMQPLKGKLKDIIIHFH